MFVPNGTLKSDEKAQDARFGYALAAAPDLNHDGFSDLVVGAPLEDEHRGAIYVYHGDGIYVNPDYKQVFSLCVCLHLTPLKERTRLSPRLLVFDFSASQGLPSLPPSGISAAA